MDARARRAAHVAGARLPSYFISKTVPVWDAAARGPWTLEVAGAVRQPLRLTLEELMRLPHVTQRVDHFCVEGWNARAEWTGVRVSDLARAAGGSPRCRLRGLPELRRRLPRELGHRQRDAPADADRVRHGRPSSAPAYGAPARLHSPVKLGYKNTKYLTRIVFMPQRNGGYWSDQGYEWYGGT